MPIINIKIKNFFRPLPGPGRDPAFAGGFCIAILLFSFCILNFLSGCGKQENISRAQDNALKSEAYYEQAIAEYQKLIERGKDLDKLYFSLGQLYFRHGEFAQAAAALKKSAHPQAHRLLALAYFNSGDFTGALEVFNKGEFSDDEYLYYYGLTCEKLNLFDQALELYAKIQGKDFLSRAGRQKENIDRSGELPLIKDIDPEVYRRISRAPAQEKYPQAGGLILYCDEKVEVTRQNTEISSLHILVKILNERGKKDFSEVSLGYDSTYEKVELEFARTIKPDGTVVAVGSRHIRDVSKYLNFPLYSNARAFIISFPEITEGACIEYQAKIWRHELLNKKDFVLNYSLQNSQPTLEAHLSVRLPREKGLKIKYLNTQYNDPDRSLAPRIKEEGGAAVYEWSFQDIPQIMPEANMPPAVEINPTFLVSTFSGWEEIYQWWWGLAQGKIKADEAIKAKVAELTKGLNAPEDKARAIYNFCAQKIRYVAVEYGRAGYEPHAAGDVFKNKYGDCKDQTILLVTMLREAGITGYPVLIATKDSYNLNSDFPGVFFDHCIAAAALKERLIFLDPTAETCSFGDLPADDQARAVLVFREDGYRIEETPFFPAAHNFLRQHLQIKVAPDGSIRAERSVYTRGVYEQAQRYWLWYTPPELVGETLKQKIQDISIGASLDKYEIEHQGDLNQPALLRYRFSGPEYLMFAGRLEIMPQLAMLDPSLTAKEKRQFPLEFQVLDTKEMDFEIELPPGVRVKYFPESLVAESRWMDFTVQYSVKGNKIYFYQKSELKKERVMQSEYPEFKKFFEGAARKIKQRIILERGG